jgi:cytochrome bd-type quinol oxidase subunit 2
VFALYFLSPLVAEFLSGTTLPIVLIFLIVPLSLYYGGGILLIRELTRRSGRGWPTILVLGLAFGILEEGVLTQSLFNPDYLASDLHLLDPGYIPALGIGALWTVFVLGGHALWSIATPIAIVEESTRSRRTTPWLGLRGLVVSAVLFLLGCVMTLVVTRAEDAAHPFSASPAQLGVSAAVVVVLVIVAFLLPHGDRRPGPGRAPSAWLVFAATMVAGVGWGLLAGATSLPWWPASIAIALVCLLILGVLVSRWARLDGWSHWHRLAIAAGALATSGWHAFVMEYSEPPVIDIISRVLYLLAAAWIVRLAVRKIRQEDPAPAGEPAADVTR